MKQFVTTRRGSIIDVSRLRLLLPYGDDQWIMTLDGIPANYTIDEDDAAIVRAAWFRLVEVAADEYRLDDGRLVLCRTATDEEAS